MLINDLQEALVNDLNRHIDQGFFKYNSRHVLIKYLDKENVIGLVPNPGSHMIESDMAGNQYWVYNYAITTKTKLRAEAHNELFELSEYLLSLNETKKLTGNGSWTFDKIEIPSQPAEIQEDLQGTATYQLDVAVYVYKKRGIL